MKQLTKKCLGAIFVLTFTGGTATAHVGKVYVDANHNGVCDKGEKGLRGICVSDGLNVVKTDADGTFELPGHARERFVFVTMPSGYKAMAHYQPIEAGKTSYDFGLQPYDAHVGKGGAHTFLQMADTEIRGAVGHDDWIAQIRQATRNENAAFVIHTGDICYESGLASHKTLMNADNMDVPVYYCVGNHDLVKGKYGEAFFEGIYGPSYYSFDVGNVHYVVTPMWGGDYRPGYTVDDVYRWLKNDLAQMDPEKSLVVFNHNYWTTGDRHLFGPTKEEPIDLDAHGLKAWIYGHVHINHITRHGKAIAVCTSMPCGGGIDHAISAFRLYDIDSKGDLSTRLRYTYVDHHVEVASHQNARAPYSINGKMPVSVNAYATVSEVKNVSIRCYLEGQPVTAWQPLNQQTDFNWYTEVELPERCTGRTVTMEVATQFADGQVDRRSQYFTYDGEASHATPATGGSWTNLLRTPSHIGVAADTVTPPLRLNWVSNAGSNIYMTSPLVADGTVYIATTDEDLRGHAAVVAMDEVTGRIRWRYATRSSVKNTIALTRGLVFAQDVWGYLYAIDATTGKLAWEYKLNVAVVPGLDDGLVASGDTVFAGAGKGLCAFDATSGKILWSNKAWEQREGTTATLSLGNGVLVGGVQWSAMYAHDAATGKLLWSRSDNGIRNRASSPAIYGGRMYFVSDRALFVLDTKTGATILRKDLPYSVDVTSTPMVSAGEIIFGTARDGIVALDRETLTEKWHFRTGEALFYTAPYTNTPSAQVESSPVLSGDVVYVGAHDGAFYTLNRTTGALLWRHHTGAPVMTTVAVVDGRIIGADYAGNVYAFSPAESVNESQSVKP